MKKGFLWLWLLPLVLITLFVLTPTMASWAGIPSQIRLFPGSEYRLDVHQPFHLIDAKGQDVTGDERQFSLIPDSLGKQEFQVRLFGVIPVRDMVVDVVPQLELYPGGQSIGVLVNPEGLVVSRIVPVRGVDGKEYYPASDGGIRPGDILVSIAGRAVRRPEHVGAIVNNMADNGQELVVVVKRNGNMLQRRVTPVLSEREDINGNVQQTYLLGLFLEDPAAGVGTMSFYDPVSKRYGALGHTITDGLGRQITINDGTIVQASIDSIKQGLRGLPGEKLGTFRDERDIMGTIDKNSPFGIYGNLQSLPPHSHFSRPIPVALGHQIELGPAEIYTVIRGSKIERFQIEITKVNNQSHPADKGLVIRVADPRLLAETGGIIQGMSGSPIVQNGMLVGAVTHVFVNDPTRGYGNLIEWMIYEAGLEIKKSDSGDSTIPNLPRAS